MSLVHVFPGPDSPPVSQVGGKGAALFRLCSAGLPVPPGAALTSAFFAPWFATLRRTEAWTTLVQGPPDARGPACETLKALALELPLDPTRLRALNDAADAVPADLFAVRSSSPEEDLEGASFAGGYETRLGVPRSGLLDAVRQCFASSLDVRVLLYKEQHGFDPLAPTIAVLLQAQLDSEVAGVGFSINPLTNDYDEAVFDAAFGLGEAVVSGAVTPEHFVVDKVSGSLVEHHAGDLDHALLLTAEGGHRTVRDHRTGERTLDAARLAELTALLSRVETLFGDPVDIEWAIADGRIWLLQARPITTWVPLPDSLRTRPGERRRLYQDVALNGGLTINAPISPIGQSWFARFGSFLVRTYIGALPVELGEGDDLWVLEGGRMYQDLSNVLWLSSPRMLARSMASTDSLVADTLRGIDGRAYRSTRRPAWASLAMALQYPLVVWRARGLLRGIARALFRPTRALERLERETGAFRDAWRDLETEQTPWELLDARGSEVIRHVIEETMPALMAGLLGDALARLAVPRRHAALGSALSRGFEGNVVVEMGGALRALSELLGAEGRADPEALASRLEARDLPADFLTAWDAFVHDFGWRGPDEVDLGSPRYRDDPILALRQLCMMEPGGFDPRAAHAERVEARREAYRTLRRASGPVRRALLDLAWSWIDRFGGHRDTPKHQYLLLFAVARRRVIALGRELVAAGRLDEAEHALELTLEDLESAASDPALDLRARRRNNTRFLDKLRRHVLAFPAVVDSRGRILRPPPRPAGPGELIGSPISPGVARGPVRILHHPGEKAVHPGDVLVAHTTDPGWTPLFVNAAAIVLEVGGALQHGAVVAREYGKPCVAGISDLLRRLEEGQHVEVDGAAGIVRVLDDEEAPRSPTHGPD